MYKAHSALFQIWCDYDKDTQTYRLKSSELKQAINEERFDYQDTYTNIYTGISDLLREMNEAQFGIIATYDKGSHAWVRDTTEAKSLDERLAHDHPIIEANQALLRCLARLRSIEYAIVQKYGTEHSLSQSIQQTLKMSFAQLLHDMISASDYLKPIEAKKKIKHNEAVFNTLLLKQLHQAELTQGCETKTQAKRLLQHYRNLSSLLEPARKMVTISYGHQNNVLDGQKKILHRETHYPVTKKTPIQKQVLKKLAVSTSYPFGKNNGDFQLLAMEEADSLFAKLLKRDDTMLPAQARKTHLVGVKNAYIVKHEIIPLNEAPRENFLEKIAQLQATPENTLWLARSGSPVFIGKGEDSQSIQTHTDENIKQILNEAKSLSHLSDKDKLSLHVTILNTNSLIEKQHTIVKHVKKYQDDNTPYTWSYIPTNIEGTLRVAMINQQVQNTLQISAELPFDKPARVKKAAKVILAAVQPNQLSLAHCASGQDRTGTALERATQDWIQNRYQTLQSTLNKKGFKINSSRHLIKKFRAESSNAAEIASHLVPGSSGMKDDSRAGNVLGKGLLSEQFYRKSAQMNKKDPVNDVPFLKNVLNYQINSLKKNLSELKYKIKHIRNETIKPYFKNCWHEISLLKNKAQLNREDYRQLQYVINALHHTMEHAGLLSNLDMNKKALRHDLTCLNMLSYHTAGKKSIGWRTLGVALLTVAACILVTACFLVAIPSGGVSIFAAMAIVLGVKTAVAGLMTAGAITATAACGVGFFAHGRQKHLSYALSQTAHQVALMER